MFDEYISAYYSEHSVDLNSKLMKDWNPLEFIFLHLHNNICLQCSRGASFTAAKNASNAKVSPDVKKKHGPRKPKALKADKLEYSIFSNFDANRYDILKRRA